MAVCRALRQIDDGGDAGLLGRLCKIHGSRDQAFLDRPDEVSGFDTFHCRADAIDFLEIAGDKLGTEDSQRVRSRIDAVRQGPDIETQRQRFADGGPTGVACGA